MARTGTDMAKTGGGLKEEKDRVWRNVTGREEREIPSLLMEVGVRELEHILGHVWVEQENDVKSERA